MILVASESNRPSARFVRLPQKHRNTEIRIASKRSSSQEGSFFFRGTPLGERVPSRAGCYPLKDFFCDSVILWQAQTWMDAKEALSEPPDIEPRDPKISHQTLKPGPYAARKPFMRLP